MENDNLATYLNDHLAGSVTAIELLERLESTYADSELYDFFKQLCADVASDQNDLQGLMEALNIGESSTRKASGWLAEKITNIKLRFDDPQSGDLRLLESLEALSLGIEGKRSLWIALIAAASESPSLRVIDYDRLTQRAQEQRNRVEKLRIEVASEALGFTIERSSRAANADAER